ncbi:hypothetical protein SS05631_c32070 [Sinorhizobium sp. CCBAU 05631]|nr:hypothetical protein SS05631_c32070 [Sinorhizobium sp. CCBAU 05631]
MDTGLFSESYRHAGSQLVQSFEIMKVIARAKRRAKPNRGKR